MSPVAPEIEALASRLQGLDAREKRILSLRFALDGSYNRTLAEIGPRFGLTADEVRAIERRALGKLLAAF